MTVEVSIDSFQQALDCSKFPISRVELCSSLESGGLTPGIGLTKLCCQLANPEVHAMIRPRTGGFIYSSTEIEVMKVEVELIAEIGAKGLVFGCLNDSNELDLIHSRELGDLAKSMGVQITFHRAFDFAKDPFRALDQLIDMGFDRVLTSGQKLSVNEGVDMIQKLVEHAAGSIQVMAGGGVNRSNALQLQSLGVDAIHFTARRAKTLNSTLGMGVEYETNIEKIKSIVELLDL